MRKLIIFGNGELAEISAYYFKNEYEISFFCIDDEYFKESNFNGIPLIKYSDLDNYKNTEYDIFVAISYKNMNLIREKKFLEIQSRGYKMPTFIHKHSYVSKNAIIGNNCLILENQTIQKNVKISDNVILWSGNHIGHSSTIDSHTYFSSHVVLSGNCKIGSRCFFGVNSTVKDFTIIEDDCFIGMASSVTRNLKKGSVTMNNTTKIFEKDDEISIKIKSKYF